MQQERGRQKDAATHARNATHSVLCAMLHTTLKSSVGMGVDRVGYGHTFAAQDESDQALAAYRTASRFFSGMSCTHPKRPCDS